MAKAEIDLKALKAAVNVILDHLLEDIGLEKLPIEEADDFYWECPAHEMYDSSTKPSDFDAGRLSDDLDFVRLIERGQSADASYNLVHVAPLLRYVGEKIKQ